MATPGSTINGSAGRDTITGTAGDDILTGGASADIITGGAGGDTFRYLSLRDAGDTILDFTPYADRLELTPLLTSIGVTAQVAISGGHVRVVDVDALGGGIVGPRERCETGVDGVQGCDEVVPEQKGIAGGGAIDGLIRYCTEQIQKRHPEIVFVILITTVLAPILLRWYTARTPQRAQVSG